MYFKDLEKFQYCKQSLSSPVTLRDVQDMDIDQCQMRPMMWYSRLQGGIQCPCSKEIDDPEPCPLSQPWPGLLDNPLADMVLDAGNEPGAQYLPSEIISRIIELCLNLVMSMLGTFNKSLFFFELSGPFNPNLYKRGTCWEFGTGQSKLLFH